MNTLSYVEDVKLYEDELGNLWVLYRDIFLPVMSVREVINIEESFNDLVLQEDYCISNS